jgi:hypothetical protein
MAGAKSRLGATVSKKYSAQFAAEVSWQRVDASGAAVEEEDITDNGDTPSGGSDDNGGGSGDNGGGSGDNGGGSGDNGGGGGSNGGGNDVN